MQALVTLHFHYMKLLEMRELLELRGLFEAGRSLHEEIRPTNDVPAEVVRKHTRGGFPVKWKWAK